MTSVLFVLALAQLTAAPPLADDPRFRPSEAYERCMATGDAARGNATAITVCAGTEQAIQDRRLDVAYDRAMDRLGFWYQVELNNALAERRDGGQARCTELAAVDRRGNAAAPAYAQCMLDETIARAAWLESYSPE
ncbi:MAG: lysozyme inhibitor LprI family protein [Sphingomicrobium sp.]